MANQIILTVSQDNSTFTINDAVPLPSNGNPVNLVTLGTLAANGSYTLPSTYQYTNMPLLLVNENTGSTYFYTVTPGIVGADGVSITTLKNSTAYLLQWDGTTWHIISETSFSYGELAAIKTISANYTAAISDDTIINTSSAGAAITLTLPTGSVFTGKVFQIVNANATASGTITLSPAVKVDNSTTTSSIAISSRLRVQFDGTNWWEIS